MRQNMVYIGLTEWYACVVKKQRSPDSWYVQEKDVFFALCGCSSPRHMGDGTFIWRRAVSRARIDMNILLHDLWLIFMNGTIFCTLVIDRTAEVSGAGLKTELRLPRFQ